MHLFLKHTSASISLNENYDPDVLKDMEDSLNRIVPENVNYRHSMEGKDGKLIKQIIKIWKKNYGF